MKDEDEILAAELGELGAAGGRAGGALAGVLGAHGAAAAGGRGGARGAQRAARRMRKDVHEIEIAVAVRLAEARVLVAGLIQATGRLIEESEDPVIVRGVVGAGAMNMNPVVLTVTLSPAATGGTTVRVRGAAKEGLIKQRAGEKAARRFTSMLTGGELPGRPVYRAGLPGCQGKTTAMSSPPPGRGLAVRAAPWASAMARTMARPSPCPSP
jgi:hypothetical protein